MKKAFTLIELMIVIGILGVLMGVILSQFGGATESSRLAVCQSNMRNLAQACQSAAMSSGYYPRAATCEYTRFASDESDEMVYGLYRGWIGRPDDHRHSGEYGSHAGGSRNIGCYHENEEEARQAITNGTLFASLSYDRKSYVCPSHSRSEIVQRAHATPHFSYAMNAYFGYDTSNGSESTATWGYPGEVGFGMNRADRRLLFAEIPFTSVQNANVSKSDSADLDCVLAYDDGIGATAPESIGFNHKSGKLTIAHVVYADCHTARLNMPKGADQGNIRDLTDWLCKGYDVVYVGGSYEKVDDSATEE